MKFFKFKFGIIYFFYIFLQNFYFQNIQIQGTSKFPETTVELYVVKNIFSPYQEKIQETKTDEKGNFTLTFNLENLYQKIGVKINFIETVFWVKKNENNQIKKYEIVFPKLKK